MASVPGKYLNQENIIKKVFDHTSDSLKVILGNFNGAITISYLDDDIAIADRNSGNFLHINSNGSLDTNIAGVTPVAGRLPVDLGGATVNVTGNVVVTSEVEVKNDAGNPIPVNGTVSVTGVSTLAEQQTQTTKLTSIDNKLTSPLSIQATNLDIRDLVFTTDKVDVSNSVIALDATTLAALENTTVTIANASLAVTGPLTDTQLRASAVPVSVNNFPSVQTVQATNFNIRPLTFVNDKVDVSNSTVNLSAGTISSLQNVNANVSGTVDLSATTLAALETIDVNILNSSLNINGTVSLSAGSLAALENISIDNFPAVQNVSIQNSSLPVTQSGTWNINNISGTISLPTGAATSALQSTINTTLGTINSTQTSGSQKSIVRGGAKGTTLAADVTSSIIDANMQALDVAIKQQPALVFATDKVDVTGSTVALDATSLAALENITVTISNEVEVKNDSGNPIPVNGTVTANIGTTNGLALDTSVNSLLKPSSTLAAVTAITNTVTIKADTPANQTNALKIDGSAVTQPISATSLPLPTGAATSALQSTGNASLASIDSKLTSPIATITTDSLIVSESFSTTSNVYSNARPTNGDMSVRKFKGKTIFVQNTSVNAGRVTITGSVDGTNYDVPILADTAIAAGVTNITSTEIAVTNVRVTVRSQTNGQTTSFVTKAYAMGV